jgi:hypothetical protein
MKHSIATFYLILILGETLSATPKVVLLEPTPPVDEKGLSAALVLLMNKLQEDSVSTDSAWEVFSAFVGKKESQRDKAMIFVSMLSNEQAPLTERTGYDVRPSGPFIRDCSVGLSITREALLRHFTTNIADDRSEEKRVRFDARKLFLSFGTNELENLIEEGLKSSQPNGATNPKSNKKPEERGGPPAIRSEPKGTP